MTFVIAAICALAFCGVQYHALRLAMAARQMKYQRPSMPKAS